MKKLAILLSLLTVISSGTSPLFAGREVMPTKPPAITFTPEMLPKNSILDPNAAYAGLTPNKDFDVDIIASEPTVAQPVHISFDARGRMWVTQYRQYPFPAGIKVIGKDRYWRAVYDKVSPPPPNHFKGKDRVTIFEDRDDDGRYDSSKDFVSDLNITSASLPGHDGVWILTPPYLLFYPDKNHDDIPDGDPIVHLKGFGLEDTHAVASSLTWGPDGWIYGAQGSTCTATIIRPGIDAEDQGFHFKGHGIWRYHPKTRDFELFAEGGGNTFSVSFNAKGQLFTGTNGGERRGAVFYYTQGGAYPKSTTKHGPHQNPYMYKTLTGVDTTDLEQSKLSQPFTMYEGHTFPAKYKGGLFTSRLLTRNINAATLEPNGSNYKTKSFPHALTGHDQSFRVVMVQTGPDGAIYLGDWWDTQIGHSRTMEKTTSKTGRIYRLQAKGVKGKVNLRLDKKDNAELFTLATSSPNGWARWTAQRLLRHRQATELLPQLKAMIIKADGEFTLDAYWTHYNLTGHLSEEMALLGLNHTNPWVRYWAIRLIGDRRQCTQKEADALASLARKETFLPVRSQLTSSAKRLPTKLIGPTIVGLLAQAADATDPDIPMLLWWTVEQHTRTNMAMVTQWFSDPSVQASPLATDHVLHYLARKAAEVSTPELHDGLAAIYQQLGDTSQKLILKTFVNYYGGDINQLKEPLVTWIKSNRKSAPDGGLAIKLREGDTSVLKKAIEKIRKGTTSWQVRIDLIKAIASKQYPAALPALLALASQPTGDTKTLPVQLAAIKAMRSYSNQKVFDTLTAQLIRPFHDAQCLAAMHQVLVSRRPWAQAYLTQLSTQQLPPPRNPQPIIQQILSYSNKDLNELTKKIWGNQFVLTNEAVEQQLAKYLKAVAAHPGDAAAGKAIYDARCATCHKLKTSGTYEYGPPLTAYERDNTEYFLGNIIDPSSYVREGYSLLVITMKDGSQQIGILAEEDNVRMTIRTAPGQTETLLRSEIDKTQILPQSPMPPGLLTGLTDQQVSDLLQYIKE